MTRTAENKRVVSQKPMTPALEKRIVRLIQRLDDCWSRNGETANMLGLVKNAKELRAIRQQLEPRQFFVIR